MDLLHRKKRIKEELDKVEDEEILLAIAHLLNLEEDESPEWHRQVVKERFAEYQRNPQNVITWDELKKKWQKDV